MSAQLILTRSPDPFTRGLDYLYGVRSLALEPDMIDLVDDLTRRVPVCTWIGQQIDRVNQRLNAHLDACHACYHLWEQSEIQIFAAPLSQAFGIDGLCNLQTHPVTILIDVGRVVPEHWLRLVVHEYAHAHAGSPGHHQQFAQTLAHLCLGLAIELPLDRLAEPDCWRSYPVCRSTSDPLAFWRGDRAERDEVVRRDW